VSEINKQVVAIIQTPDMQKQIRDQGAVPNPDTPAEFAAFIGSEGRKWAEVVRRANVTTE
jgi:tripartite-type tricarboxylate transporter receptor subunit TctC